MNLRDEPIELAVAERQTNLNSKDLPCDAPGAEVIEHLGVRLDGYRHQAFLDGVELRLTPTEYRLLECFLRAPGRAFAREELAARAISKADVVEKRTIDVHIKSLRKKLRHARELIETVQGFGYRLRECSG